MKRNVVVLLLTLTVLFLFFVAARLAAPIKHYSPGREIRYDDFGFTALSVVESPAVGERVAPRGNSYYTVTVRISNYAKRVTYDFQTSIVKVSEQSGRALRPAVWPSSDYTIEHGQSAKSELVFEGPSGLRDLRVSFKEGGPVGEILDAIFYGKMDVLLAVAR